MTSAQVSRHPWLLPGTTGVLALAGMVSLAAQVPVPTAGTDVPAAPQLVELGYAAVRLPLATALACILALRPRRRGTPTRNMAVVQTQIILAVVGALVMLVVGSSLARAFGIVGAAGLVRYRAKVDDPKDAGVMLSTLAVGLAAGVGQWLIALFGTAFLLAVLWVVESFEPSPMRLLTIKVRGANVGEHKGRVEGLFRRHRAPFETRGVSAEELQYELRWPLDRPVDRLSERITTLDRATPLQVEIEAKKDK